MKVSLTLSSSLAARVQRAAEMRGLPVAEYVLVMLQWHSPAYDNDAQYLKSKLREVLAGCTSRTGQLMQIEALVK